MIEPGFWVDSSRRATRGEKCGADVQPHDGVEVQDRHLGEGLRPVHAGVVEEHVVGVAVRDEPREGVEISDVASLRIGRAAAGADRRGAGVDLLARARNERHMRAGIGERRRRGQPDAAPGPGHERASAVEAERGGGGKGHAGLRAWVTPLPEGEG